MRKAGLQRSSSSSASSAARPNAARNVTRWAVGLSTLILCAGCSTTPPNLERLQAENRILRAMVERAEEDVDALKEGLTKCLSKQGAQ